jgi:hypothetical protein
LVRSQRIRPVVAAVAAVVVAAVAAAVAAVVAAVAVAAVAVPSENALVPNAAEPTLADGS